MLLLGRLQELGVRFRVVYLSTIKVSCRSFSMASTTWLLHYGSGLEDGGGAGRGGQYGEVLTHLTLARMHVVLRSNFVVVTLGGLRRHKKRWLALALLLANLIIVIIVYFPTNPTITIILKKCSIGAWAQNFLLLSLLKSLRFVKSSIRLFRGMINAILLLSLGPIDSKWI